MYILRPELYEKKSWFGPMEYSPEKARQEYVRLNDKIFKNKKDIYNTDFPLMSQYREFYDTQLKNSTDLRKRKNHDEFLFAEKQLKESNEKLEELKKLSVQLRDPITNNILDKKDYKRKALLNAYINDVNEKKENESKKNTLIKKSYELARNAYVGDIIKARKFEDNFGWGFLKYAYVLGLTGFAGKQFYDSVVK